MSRRKHVLCLTFVNIDRGKYERLAQNISLEVQNIIYIIDYLQKKEKKREVLKKAIGQFIVERIV